MSHGCQQAQNSKILTIEQLIGMSEEQKIDLFRQGYIIGPSQIVNKVENSNIGITGLGLPSKANIKTMVTTTDITLGSVALLVLSILVMSGVYVYIGNWELKKLGIRQ